MAGKLCINCKHYQAGDYPDAAHQAEFARCLAVLSISDQRLTRIDGRTVRGMFCEIAREAGPCGDDATLFEERAA